MGFDRPYRFAVQLLLSKYPIFMVSSIALLYFGINNLHYWLLGASMLGMLVASRSPGRGPSNCT